MKLRVIGDVHGLFSCYHELIREVPYGTLQIGDMGIGFTGDNNFAPAPKDKFFRGNHDNPEKCWKHPNYTADILADSLFTVAGGYSIDHAWRIPGVSWWENEEISYPELESTIDVYKKVKPTIMISHEAPAFLASYMVGQGRVFPPSRTALALGRMFAAHQPKIWIYGHWHMNFRKQIGDTLFICLPELAYLDLEWEGDDIVIGDTVEFK